MRSKDHSLKAPKASHQISLGVGITAYVQNTVAGHGAKQICSMVFQPPKKERCGEVPFTKGAWAQGQNGKGWLIGK